VWSAGLLFNAFSILGRACGNASHRAR